MQPSQALKTLGCAIFYKLSAEIACRLQDEDEDAVLLVDDEPAQTAAADEASAVTTANG